MVCYIFVLDIHRAWSLEGKSTSIPSWRSWKTSTWSSWWLYFVSFPKTQWHLMTWIASICSSFWISLYHQSWTKLVMHLQSLKIQHSIQIWLHLLLSQHSPSQSLRIVLGQRLQLLHGLFDLVFFACLSVSEPNIGCGFHYILFFEHHQGNYMAGEAEPLC